MTAIVARNLTRLAVKCAGEGGLGMKMIDRDGLGPKPSREKSLMWSLVVTGTAVLISLGSPFTEGTKASAQIIRSHPMARRQPGRPLAEGDGVYTINYFKSDGTVMSERFMGKRAMAQERVDRAVAAGTAERGQLRDGKSGKVIYRSVRAQK